MTWSSWSPTRRSSLSLSPLRVILIEDQSIFRQAVIDLLAREREIEIIGQAADGDEGLRLCHAAQPDAILLDLEMPRLDGFGFLRLLMARRPTPVIVFSGHASQQNVFRALELGAVDFVAKPMRALVGSDLEPLRDDLLRKLRQTRGLLVTRLSQRPPVHSRPPGAPPPPPGSPLPRSRSTEDLLHALRPDGGVLAPARLLCIGASTGGPPAISTLLSGLDPRLPVGILVTQHIPASFTRAFAERLARTTPWPVREAETGAVIGPGEVTVASGSHSLRVHQDGMFVRIREPLAGESRSDGYVPSIDRMLESAAQAMGPRVIAAILTGMSGDGTSGVKAVHAAGGRVLAEDPSTAVLASMPEDAIRAGVVHEVAPLAKMADSITRMILNKR